MRGSHRSNSPLENLGTLETGETASQLRRWVVVKRVMGVGGSLKTDGESFIEATHQHRFAVESVLIASLPCTRSTQNRKFVNWFHMAIEKASGMKEPRQSRRWESIGSRSRVAPIPIKKIISLKPTPTVSILKMPEPEEASTSSTNVTFKSLGLIDPLLEALEQMKFKTPTDIQAEALPHALQGRDIIGVASTGSGKTAAFALPILQKLWEEPKGLFACVISPTRELAYQISQQFEALGSTMGVRCVVIVGGMDLMSQKVALAKKPHIVVATPGRLNDHLENTKGFSLRTLKFLVRNLPPSPLTAALMITPEVLDEADKLLDLDLGPVIDKILKVIPKERTTYLFSATMTTKVAKLQRASLSNPVRVEVSSK